MEIEIDCPRGVYNIAKNHCYHTKATLAYLDLDSGIHNTLRWLGYAIALWKSASLTHLSAYENLPALDTTK